MRNHSDVAWPVRLVVVKKRRNHWLWKLDRGLSSLIGRARSGRDSCAMIISEPEVVRVATNGSERTTRCHGFLESSLSRSQKGKDSMKVGLLTGGGDCPGLNAVIRAVVQQLANGGASCVGILEGWRGLVQNMTSPLTVAATDGIISQGGSILGASRTNPYRNPDSNLAALRENFARLDLSSLIVIGGDDTLGVAIRLHNDFGIPVVGIPKTIDNDLAVTDFSFGFDTAINIVTEAVDRLRTTAESHRRIMVVETMGRHSGWIACFAGIDRKSVV